MRQPGGHPPRAAGIARTLHRDTGRALRGAFPFWLAPVQARVVPVGEGHREAAGALRDRIVAEGFRAEVDERDETLGKRIREAELEKVPFVVVYGDHESEDALAVRSAAGISRRSRSTSCSGVPHACRRR